MNDEQIIEYLRSRSRVEVPMGLSQRVMAEVAVTPARRSLFATLMPAAASVMVVAIIAVAALLVFSAPPNVGPSATPSPMPTSTPAPTPSMTLTTPPAGYVAVPGLPFTVLANPEADALFGDVQTCTSEAGYTVDFPADWYTNAAQADTPACSWFGPEPFEGSVVPVAVKPLPAGVWIALEIFDGGAGYAGETPIFMFERLSIAGFDAQRAEFGPLAPDVNGSPSEERGYWYLVPFAEVGPTFIAQTSTDYAADYSLAKAVLDRIVASVRFDG